MIPLSKLHKHMAVPIWYFLIFIFFMAAIFLIAKILNSDNPEKGCSRAYYFVAILISLRFLLSLIQRVQSDGLVLFLLSLFIYTLFLNKQTLAGISLASAAMVKLTPLIFLPYLLIRKRLKAVGAFCLAILFYLLGPALYLGPGKNLVYLKNWFLVHQGNPAEYIIWYKNQSLISCLFRLFTKDSSVAILNLEPTLVTVIFIILACVLFSLIFIFCRNLKPALANKQGQAGLPYLLEISLVLICMIIFSPLAWKHTFVHLIIPHLVLLYYLFYINPADRIVKRLLIVSFCINTVLNPELTKPFAQLIQMYSNVTFGTLILFVALLMVAHKVCVRSLSFPHTTK